MISQGNDGDYVDVGSSPAVSERTVAVAAANKSKQIADFSSRGVHGSFKERVKPDVTAVGVDVRSAKSGSGSDAASASGTSMSAPVTSGVLAIEMSGHSSWRTGDDTAALRFKSTLMNTASTDVLDSAGNSYSLSRTGTGMVNAYDAARSDVWLASDDNDHLVTASFGVVEAAQPLTETRTITVHNEGTAGHTFNAKYVGRYDAPGVSFSVSPSTFTVAAKQTAKVTITLTISDPSQLRRVIDPTMKTTTSIANGSSKLPRQYVTEAIGMLDLQIANPDQDSHPFLRLGVYAAPKLATEITAQAPMFDGSDPLVGKVALTGTGYDIGNPGTGVTQPLTMAFQWGATDDVNSTDPKANLKRQSDIDVVGAATNSPSLTDKSKGTLYFALAVRGGDHHRIASMAA
ncbi:S8 family serine peptidase [Rarobacter incanus]|uniref:Subtilase family protein n=1 Tax=Rarobacter incanus TaxID=153494 RepID=A0A542SQN5_9MICO|nr:subtilase family protein [Rarobacter incanus]